MKVYDTLSSIHTKSIPPLKTNPGHQYEASTPLISNLRSINPNSPLQLRRIRLPLPLLTLPRFIHIRMHRIRIRESLLFRGYTR